MATDPFFEKMTVDEFLAIDFGDRKVELVDGVIYAMAGGKRSHARIQRNLLSALGARPRGSGCSAYVGFGVAIGEAMLLYPDVSVERGHPDTGLDDDDRVLREPVLLIEVLSSSTRTHDETTKLLAYQRLASVAAIILVDPDAETIRVVQRLGPSSWRSDLFPAPADLELPFLGITIPKEEIFARD